MTECTKLKVVNLILAHVRVHRVIVWPESRSSEQLVRSHCVYSQKAESSECWCSAHFSLFIQSGLWSIGCAVHILKCFSLLNSAFLDILLSEEGIMLTLALVMVTVKLSHQIPPHTVDGVKEKVRG